MVAMLEKTASTDVLGNSHDTSVLRKGAMGHLQTNDLATIRQILKGMKDSHASFYKSIRLEISDGTIYTGLNLIELLPFFGGMEYDVSLASCRLCWENLTIVSLDDINWLEARPNETAACKCTQYHP